MSFVLNIVQTVIVGVLTYVLKNAIDSSRKIKRIEKANQDMLSALKPFLLTPHLFSLDIFTSITASLARKYKLDTHSIWSLTEICNNLIYEIIQTEFIPESKKIEICESLVRFKKTDENISPQNSDIKIGAFTYILIALLIPLMILANSKNLYIPLDAPTTVLIQFVFLILIALLCVIEIIYYTYKLFK